MASLYSQRQAASWAPQPAPGARAAQSVSILNPLGSRPELGQLPNTAFVSDTDVEGEVGRHRRILNGQLNTPISSCLVLPKSFSAAPPVERQTSLTLPPHSIWSQGLLSPRPAPQVPFLSMSSPPPHTHTSSKFSPSYGDNFGSCTDTVYTQMHRGAWQNESLPINLIYSL